MDAIIRIAFIWGVPVLLNLVLVSARYTNPKTGQPEHTISAKDPEDSWLKHVFLITTFVLGGPLTWIGICIDILLECYVKKYPTYPYEA